MSNQEAPISFTTKIGGDLLTFRANTVDEFIALADTAVTNTAFASAVGLLQSLTADSATSVASTMLGATVVEEDTWTRPAAPAAPAWTAPAAAAPMCDHGQPMKLVPAGVSKKTGKPFKAFYCCANPDRESQCKKTVSV